MKNKFFKIIYKIFLPKYKYAKFSGVKLVKIHLLPQQNGLLRHI